MKLVYILIFLQSFCSAETFICKKFLPSDFPKHRSNPDLRFDTSPILSGDAFRAHADFIYDETNIPFDPDLVMPGDIIFVNSSLTYSFLKHLLPKINNPFILVTHNRTHVFKKRDYPAINKYINSDKIIKWFDRDNKGYEHPKRVTLPLGLNYRLSGDDFHYFINKASQKKSYDEKTIFCYFNMRLDTHDSRKDVYQTLKGRDFITFTQRKPFPKYVDDLSNSLFVISPRGFNLDCFRNWEALSLGAIPVISSTDADEKFEGLPVVIVDSYDIVTKEFLLSKLEEIKNTEYNYEKINASYWINQILELQETVRKEHAAPAEASEQTQNTAGEQPSEARGEEPPQAPEQPSAEQSTESSGEEQKIPQRRVYKPPFRNLPIRKPLIV